jgi:hypothetical protein
LRSVTPATRAHAALAFPLAAAIAVAACGAPNGSVTDDEQARRAYAGVDRSVEKAINLGLAGYGSSSSANIAPQMTTGDAAGTLEVRGQVSRGTGSSGNSEMRLLTTYTAYSDPVSLADGGTLRVTYAGPLPGAADLNMSLRNIPDGTFSGTLVRSLTMTGDLTGEVALNLQFSGRLRPASGMPDRVERVPGATTITGTATSRYGTFSVNVTR